MVGAEEQQTQPEPRRHSDAQRAPADVPGLVLFFSADDVSHVGAWFGCREANWNKPLLLGRGAAREEDGYARLEPILQRPGRNERLGPLQSPSLSRAQLLVRRSQEGVLEVENVGKCAVLHNGAAVDRAMVRPGDILEIGSRLVFLAVSRPPTLPAGHRVEFPFGSADAHGYVGESPAAWALRSSLVFAAGRRGHVLLLGASGSGKELAARSLHGESGRSGTFVARNAATLPETLVDAELFGNVRGFPNPGMAERPGLVGAAQGGTLFLDEIADLPTGVQTHLLRVLDRGEYQRLGDATPKTSDFRLIAATNADEGSLRHDLLARFEFVIRVPDLSVRREDLCFLVRHMLHAMTEDDAALRGRALDARGWPAMSAGFAGRLARHPFGSNARQLRSLLWRALESATDGELRWPDDEGAEPSDERAEPIGDDASTDSDLQRIQEVLAENNGSIEKSWRPLGLPSRHALARLLRKNGVVVARRAGGR
jgi:transcriptional regulator with AAA-type ATPase domain